MKNALIYVVLLGALNTILLTDIVSVQPPIITTLNHGVGIK
ncbi:hypothetical protein J2Z69_000676 [Paenibacillus shirakamiensis]|uniref:Uncharacterized protein n=1 Tax=Paenibacillus shirakamiensis TaxID=1265935 RepID=A0ABS4JD63_9BACL|nr:hypothetical protein [Paenibacillus shirakamiensis]